MILYGGRKFNVNIVEIINNSKVNVTNIAANNKNNGVMSRT